MKTKFGCFLWVAFTLFQGFSQRAIGVRIGYVDMEYILENVEEYRDASQQLDTKAEKWKKEIELKWSEIEQMKEELTAEKVLLTPELVTEREEEIRFLEAEVIDYQQARFGPQGDLILQKKLLVQPIQDQVFAEVQKIGANKRYDFILDKSADVVMLYSDKRHDISDLVLREISRTRKVSGGKKKENESKRLEEFKDREAASESEEVSQAIKDRDAKASEVREERAQAAEERRQEQLKLREDRKKAYEERRKKLLEEREARRKAGMQKDIEQPKDSTDQG